MRAFECTILLSLLAYTSSTASVDDALRQRATQVLRTALDREQQWIKVHAAEALLAAGDAQGVKPAFERELAEKSNQRPYRIGIWRVLAQAARSEDAREAWVQNIVKAFLDTDSSDRLHASETLGKLRYRVNGDDRDAFELVARTGAGPLAANARWVLANSGRDPDIARLVELLGSDDAATRSAAAYAVRFIPRISPAAWGRLFAATRKEPDAADADIVRASLVSAAFVHAPVSQQKGMFKVDVLKYARTGSADARIESCAALAMQGQDEDVPLLASLLDDANVDVRVAAANAILQIDRRQIKGR